MRTRRCGNENLGASELVALNVIDTGAGAASVLPPLVLLHGIGSSVEDWESQIPFFSSYCRVVAPDLRGFGHSPKARDYSVSAFSADVWALLGRLGIQRFNVIGHSMGGAVALQMAVERPERVERLVLADTLASFKIDSVGKLGLYWYRLAMMKIFGPARLSEAVSMRLFPRPEQAELRHRLAGRSALNDRDVYVRTIRAIKGWTVMDQLSRLTMPVLILAAEEDYFPVRDAQRLAQTLPNARLEVFEHAHHHLPLECAERFNATVLRFLRQDSGEDHVPT